MVRAAKSRSACGITSLASTILLVATRASAQDAPPPPPTVAPPPQVIIVTDRPHATLFGDVRYRSPGVAVALSLTPVPVDFGNLYAENVGWASRIRRSSCRSAPR